MRLFVAGDRFQNSKTHKHFQKLNPNIEKTDSMALSRDKEGISFDIIFLSDV